MLPESSSALSAQFFLVHRMCEVGLKLTHHTSGPGAAIGGGGAGSAPITKKFPFATTYRRGARWVSRRHCPHSPILTCTPLLHTPRPTIHELLLMLLRRAQELRLRGRRHKVMQRGALDTQLPRSCQRHPEFGSATLQQLLEFQFPILKKTLRTNTPPTTPQLLLLINACILPSGLTNPPALDTAPNCTTSRPEEARESCSSASTMAVGNKTPRSSANAAKVQSILPCCRWMSRRASGRQKRESGAGGGEERERAVQSSTFTE